MRALVACLVLVALSVTATEAQTSHSLRPGELLAGTLTSDVHRYALELGSGSFVYGEVNQISVDVVVTVFDPSGNEVREYDAPARGLEPFQFETEASGTYVVQVAGFEGAEGDYTVLVLRAEPLATDPRGRVDQMMAPYSGPETPGAVVGVVRDGELVFARAYGMANLEHGVPFEVGTVSNIGSVTKQFTAMALLLLEEEGKLDLDDDIRRHVPELPGFGAPITVRNLLNHTSGYREVYNLLPMAGFQGEDAFRREGVIEIIQRQKELQAEPNTEFNYNNSGYILLSMTIERLSGMTYPEFLKERVFQPLGMKDTRVKAYQGQIVPGSSTGYVTAEDGGFRTARDLAASYGAGGIYTTVADLTRWMLNYRDGTLGGRSAVEAITTKAILADGDTSSYGLGMGIGELGGRTIYQHTGGDTAHRAYFAYLPQLQSGVILMSNNGGFDLSMGPRIARLFFADSLEQEEEAAEPAVADAVEIPAERMEAIAGRWVIDAQGASLDMEITVEEGNLYAQAAGQPRFRMIPTSSSEFALDGVAATLAFAFEDDGTSERATLRQGADMPMRRIPEAVLTADDLEAYVGRYLSEELDTFYELSVEDGALMAHRFMAEPFEVMHRQGEEFSTAQFYFATLVFERDAGRRVLGFMASNGRTKGVWFAKQ